LLKAGFEWGAFFWFLRLNTNDSINIANWFLATPLYLVRWLVWENTRSYELRIFVIKLSLIWRKKLWNSGVWWEKYGEN
jgi:hypothetical protein